jgi:hypothetical protein
MIGDGTLPKQHEASEKVLDIAAQHQELGDEQETEDLANMIEENKQQEELRDLLQQWARKKKSETNKKFWTGSRGGFKS